MVSSFADRRIMGMALRLFFAGDISIPSSSGIITNNKVGRVLFYPYPALPFSASSMVLVAKRVGNE